LDDINQKISLIENKIFQLENEPVIFDSYDSKNFKIQTKGIVELKRPHDDFKIKQFKQLVTVTELKSPSSDKIAFQYELDFARLISFN